MKAVTWRGVNEIGVEDVPEPKILNDHDIILEVGLSVTCGSDLHLLGGYIPAMRAGDVLGHEFMGTVAEVGKNVTKHKVGDRVVVVSFTSCGQCWYCRQGLWSLCDNGNPNPGITEALWGQSIGGCFGYSHAMGGWAGSHANYIRVPFADVNVFPVPEDVPDEKAVFVSDACPQGFMGADLAGIQPGDVVAVWGCGPVGLFSVLSAFQKGAHRVIAIDGHEDRLERARMLGAETRDAAPEDAGEILAGELIRIMRRVGMPNGLAAIGFTEADVPALVEGTLPQHRVTKLAPRPAGPDDLAALFRDAMRYW